MKWDWNRFFAKLTSRKFWVWIGTMGFAYALLDKCDDQAWMSLVVIVWGIVTVIYLCGEVIIDAMGKAVEKADISLKLGVGK